MFKPDRAILSSTEDLLDRSSFACSLGEAIINYKDKDSVVIGLFGEWGSGKTSIINMMREYIIRNKYNQKEYRNIAGINFAQLYADYDD